MALKPIEILINAKDNASKVFDGLNAKLTTVAAAIAGYFGISAFANVITGAADFEEAMSRVQAATNSSGDELKLLKTAAEQAGLAGKVSSVAAANALENLAKAGLNGKEAIQALPAVMSMASAGGVDLADAAEKLTGVVMGMGLQFSESGRVADVLAKGANISRTSITGLAEAMSYAAPIAKTVGLSLESTVAIVGQFSNAGIDASRAGTALNSILSEFSDPASKFREELSKLGINTRDFDQALKGLAAAGTKGAEAVRAVGTEAGPALLAVLNLGIPALAELRKQLDDSKGSAEATAEIMKNNLNGAIGDLSATWEAVKHVLGEPVLPVLKSGIDELAGALRVAVENGTIAKFGTALATAFESAITWMRAFAATVDFTQLSADLQGFAARTGEVFTQIGEYATNAGNIVKLVYGAMSAGTNAVLTAVYGIGSAFSGVASNIQSGLALIYDAIAKVTFGDVSKRYKEAADSMRLSAEATWAASEELGRKSTAAFVATADSAQLARDGFAGLADGAAASTPAIAGAAAAAEASAEKIAKVNAAVAVMRQEYAALIAKGDLEAAAAKTREIDAALASLSATLPAATDAQKKKTDADAKASAAAAEHAAALAKLRAEYAALIASGDLQGAAEKLQEINKALQDAGPASKDAAKAAEELAAAYTNLGVTSSAALTNLAAKAKADFETIKNSGTASADDVANAFKAYAEKAIAANKGIASEAIKTEAAMRGYKIEVDETGKNSLKLATATDAVAASFAKAGDAAKAKAIAMKAESDLMLSGLSLRKSELDAAIAVAEAQGDETKVIKLKIEQKRIEIQIIQETMRAQIAEAESSIEVAKAKMSELEATGSLTAEKRAELDAQIKSSQAKVNEAKARGESVRVLEQEIKTLQGSSNAQDANTSSLNRSTAAIERQNKEKERTIAALEKENELKQRQIDLYNAYWKMDAEHNSVGPDGKRIEVAGQTQQSLYNAAKDTGLTAGQAKDLADKYAPQKNATGYSQFDNNGFWAAVNELKQQNELNAERAESDKKNADKRQALQDEQDKKYNDAIQKMGQAGGNVAPPSPAPVPVPRASPAPRPQNQGGGSASITPAPTTTYVSNISLPGVGTASPKFDSPSDQAQMDKILRALTSASGVAQ